MHEQPDRTAGRPSDTDHRKLGGLVDLHAEAKFARIEFDGAFHVGDAQCEPFQSKFRHGPISLSARSVRDELRPANCTN